MQIMKKKKKSNVFLNPNEKVTFNKMDTFWTHMNKGEQSLAQL